MCTSAGYTDHGYGAHAGTSYWGAPTGINGHNCTNYVAYVVAVQNGATTWTSGDAKDWDNNAPAGSVNSTPAVGAVAQWEASPAHPIYGHVAYVESVNADGSITISQDNWSTGPFGWQTIAAGSANWPHRFIHFKDASIATSSLVTLDGVQHVYAAAGNTVEDISWGNGAPVTQWLVASLGSAVTSLSSQLVGGVQHIYAGTASGGVDDISWGNGAPLTVWQVSNLGSPVTTVSSQVVNSVQHVYAATGPTVTDISWGNGVPLTAWQVGVFSSAVTTIASQFAGGVQHVQVGTASGSVHDISWGNGAPLTAWQVGSFATGVTSISSQVIGGVIHVYTATGKTVQDISWGNGAPLTIWQVGSFTSPSTGMDSPVTTINSQVTSGGVQHVYASTGSVVDDISWGNGAPLTIWQVGNLTSSTTSMTSQVINGIQHIYDNTGFTIQDISWGNGNPLTAWQVGTV